MIAVDIYLINGNTPNNSSVFRKLPDIIIKVKLKAKLKAK